ncbi:G/U mismatch-specific DNA glycosylase [Saccharopolyspora rhizosphaerae]|uniref:G/U mismatch-specific DNA glycosylase n=1 Tax=Saccharopolyspora rhizosphaerae TaxID=2492662 RepID=A0A3R8VM88_9PSEU|nr:G/U mismatch-specific DNA glycosylase [Saccharopolyspora rhizosphaerae]RRO20557.1 G/U mismatch-specific DNA glycosylase [Saccharopolyspora rhizosphaerae]
MSGDRPSAQELEAASGATIGDVLAPGLKVLFCGINPGLWSGATGCHFARPGNRFWPVLHASSFTPRQLAPQEQSELLELGLGITNLVDRATSKAAELTDEELQAGAQALSEKVQRYQPQWVAVVGITAYRAAFGAKRATFGRQERTIGEAGVWVLPNPSGLNAHWSAGTLAAEFGQLRQAVMAGEECRCG